MDNYESKAEQIKSEIMVLRDLLRRSGWYLGTDVQSSPPTRGETKNFLAELRQVLKGESDD